MPSLYEINKQIEEVINNGFAVNEETGEILFDSSNLDDLQEAFDEKLDNVACFIKDQEALASAIADEIKALQGRKKALEARCDYLKEYIAQNMNKRDMKKLETTRNKIGFRKSTSVTILDESLIPDTFKKEEVTIKISKKDIGDALKKGEQVAGAVLTESMNLQIK